MKYFCYQSNDHDCGFAALKMMLATLNHCRSYLYLPKNEKRSYFSFTDLKDIASKYGLTLKAYHYQVKEVNELKPCLAVIYGQHLVYIKDVSHGVYTIYDPAQGIYKMKASKFDEIWTGDTLEIDSYVKTEYKTKRNYIIPMRFFIVSALISVLAVVSLAIGFFFVKNDSYIFLPIIFIALFSICELVENWYLIKSINWFDKKYVPLIFENKNENAMDTYKDYINFKKDYFSFGRKFFSAMLTSSFVLVILILNDPINSIMLIGIVLLLILERLLFKRRDTEFMDNLSHNEQLLITNSNANLVEDILMISHSSGGYVLNLSVRKCINTFIIIVLSFTMMMISQTVSVNYIIFHFAAYYLFYSNIDIVLTMGENKKQYDMSKARFLDTCNL
ncbi:MAG: hypothetical protein K6E11_03300 [Bacilli bacterium]|nr:hypothetical protein [Bacilli bacterium]